MTPLIPHVCGSRPSHRLGWWKVIVQFIIIIVITIMISFRYSFTDFSGHHFFFYENETQWTLNECVVNG